jgi:hypothetical protein
MNDQHHATFLQRIAGVMPSVKALESVVDGLETQGFDRAQFGVLANEDALPVGENAAALAADPKVRTDADSYPETEGAVSGALIGGLAYVGAIAAAGAVILTGGALGVALAALAAAGGASGLVGALVAHGFEQDHARLIEDQLSRGGVVLWIQPRDEAQLNSAAAALKAAGATTIVGHADA